ncbi:MAG TPA: caspase family protein, partial [Bacteroidales bacterium]|nr:caspase family protein [Bacteroidales bacterium]
MKPIGILIVLFLLFGNHLLMSQNNPETKKRALIVAIGDYQPETFWAKINSANDIGLVRGVLNKQGFTNENILLVHDSEATLQGIKDAFEKLIAATNPGDYVVVHFSCHGQQITDDNGDEADGLDEAMVPYGAPANNTGKWANYRGELHLRDDAIGEYITRIRGRAGSKGQVLLTIDACHSGTASRGSDVFRGGAQAMQLKNIAVTTQKPKT